MEVLYWRGIVISYKLCFFSLTLGLACALPGDSLRENTPAHLVTPPIPTEMAKSIKIEAMLTYVKVS